MNIMIIGGGKIGFYLAKTLLEENHNVHLIEASRENCNYIANNLDIPIYCGDGTTIETLEIAGIKKIDILIAVTGKDENNLIACQLAKMRWGTKKTIARVNNPKNVSVVRQLGVDTVVSSVEIISNLIQQEIDIAGIKVLSSIGGGKASVLQLRIPEDSPVNGQALRNIELPPDTVMTSIIRAGELIIPRGETKLYSGDEIIIVSALDRSHKLERLFGLI